MNKRDKQNKNRKRIIAFLLLFSLALTSGTFAYWANFVEGTSTEAVGTLSVGSAEAVRTKFELTNDFSSGGHLVPEFQVENSQEADAVESIVISHDIQWLEDELESQLEGTSSEGILQEWHFVVIELDGEILPYEGNEDVYALVNVVRSENNSSTLTLDDPALTQSYTITLDEPSNQSEYNRIANANITVYFNYKISDKDITVTDIEDAGSVFDPNVAEDRDAAEFNGFFFPVDTNNSSDES